MPMIPDDEDLLGDTSFREAFAQVKPPAKATTNTRAPKKTPPCQRHPSANSAKRAATSDFWCCLILSFMAFGGYGLWTVPARDRTLANFETKLQFIQRALGGELEEQNRQLNSTLQGERKQEAALRKEEATLRRQLLEANNQQVLLHEKLKVKESSYEVAQKDIVKARSGLQNWHRKSDTLQSRLALIQKDDAKKQTALERSSREMSMADRQLHQLEKALEDAGKKISGLESTEKNLRGQLQKQARWRQETVSKFRRYKDAEETLMKSIELD